MAGLVRLVGALEGSTDVEHARASIVLRFGAGQTLTCLAELSVIEEMAGVLEKTVRLIRRTAPPAALAEEVVDYAIDREERRDRVRLRLVTAGGRSHAYAVPRASALEIASGLQAESERRPAAGPGPA